MMDSRQEFDKWSDEHWNTQAEMMPFTIWQACQALNDKRIAELEAKLNQAYTDLNNQSLKLRTAIEALEHYANRQNWHKDSQEYGSYEVSDYIIIYNDFYEQNQATRYAGNKAREALDKMKG